MIFSFDNHSFSSNKCRGVLHTPWCERKRSPPIPQSSQDFNRTSVGAYRIRPHVSENETMAANTSPSSAVHLRRCGGRMRYAPTVLRYREMMQKRLEATSSPNCTLRKHALKQLQVQIVHCTRPFLHRSKPFCTRRKAPWTNFNTLLRTCKNPLN